MQDDRRKKGGMESHAPLIREALEVVLTRLCSPGCLINFQRRLANK